MFQLIFPILNCFDCLNTEFEVRRIDILFSGSLNCSALRVSSLDFPKIKSGKIKSMDPSKYGPINLLKKGVKVLEKLLINKINQHMYK